MALMQDRAVARGGAGGARPPNNYGGKSINR